MSAVLDTPTVTSTPAATAQTTATPHRARPVWNADFEAELFNRVLQVHAPHLPLQPPADTRDAQTPEELTEVAEFTARVAAHDTFIVQAISRAIAHLPELQADTDFQLKLSRQVGDDGHHAVLARERLLEITGQDQLPRIEGYITQLWAALGDLPYRDLFGFLAFQFHYELHIQGRLRTEGRTAQIRWKRKAEGHAADSGSRYAKEGEANDELSHRIAIVEWVGKLLDAVPADERERWIAKLLAADDEAQRRLNPYLRHRIANAGRAWQSDVRDVVPVYDSFRREVLAYLVDKPAADLPRLTSLAA